MTGTALNLELLPGGLALVTFDQPGSRANILSQAACGDLENLLNDLESRSNLQGLVLQSGKPGMFIAGADLKELGQAPFDPIQSVALCRRGLEILARLEALPYATVALIDGPCLGGGLEVALAFDYRLAGTHPKTELGLPEVKLGLIPGWGGTQRLPRLIGAAAALDMICGGASIKADRAQTLGLVQELVASEQLPAAATELLGRVQPTQDWHLSRQRKRQSLDQAVESSVLDAVLLNIQALEADQQPAALAALEVIQRGCVLSLQEGLALETEEFGKLLGSEPSRRLIAQFFQSRRPPPAAPSAVSP